MAEFAYHEMFPVHDDATPYRALTSDGIGEARLGA